MPTFKIQIEGITYTTKGKSALDAVLTILNDLGLRYEFTDFEVKEIKDASNNHHN